MTLFAFGMALLTFGMAFSLGSRSRREDGATEHHPAAAKHEGVSLSGMKSRVQRARERVLREVQHCCGLHRDARGTVRGLGADEGCAPPASFHQIERPRK